MAKPANKTREERFFTVQKVFPPSDHLGLGLLCLMAAYNDVGRVVDWMRAEPDNQTDEPARRISGARKSMHYRMAFAFLHEAMKVVREMQTLEGFGEIEQRLDAPGKEALAALREEGRNFNDSVLRVMDQVRNKATFHYIRSQFADAIKEFKAKRGEDVESSFIFERQPGGGIRAYYLLADHIRDAAGFGVVTADEANKIVLDVIKIQGRLITFLDSAMMAYAEFRNLAGQFRSEQSR